MRTKLSNRVLALVLSIMMCISLFPAQVFAEDANTVSLDEGEEIVTGEASNATTDCGGNHTPSGPGVYTSGTCQTLGYTTYTCAVCGETFVLYDQTYADHIPAGDGVYTSGTCQTPGYITYTCAVCGQEYTMEGDLEDHDYDENGYCRVCGAKKSSTAGGSLTDTLSWKIADNVLTFEGSGVIPNYDTRPWHNYYEDITVIVIGEGITGIEDYALSAFDALESVDIADSVTTIGNYAFAGCGLKSITIPKNVTGLNYNVFNGLDALEEIIVDSANTDYSSLDGVLYNKDRTELIFYPQNKPGASFTVPASVTAIGDKAFYKEDLDGKLLTIIFTGNEPTFGTYPFRNNRPYLFYPNNDSTWSTDDLPTQAGLVTWKSYTPGETITFASGTCGDDLKWVLDAYCVLTISGTGAMKEFDYSDLKWDLYTNYIVSAVIESGVTTIGSRAFNGCSRLESVSIPDTVASIGSYAFNGCSSLTDITIPDAVTSIGSDAFYNCDALTGVTVPALVESLGEYAFGDCGGLQSITFLGSAPTIGANAFYLDTLTVSYPPENSTWASIVNSEDNQYGGTAITWGDYECEHTAVTDPAVTPTCTTAGLTQGSHCSKCGYVIKAQEVIEALGHDYVITETEATCTEPGIRTYTCSRCGDSYTEETDPALGHDYKVTAKTEATCTEWESKTYTCSRCGDSYTEETAALGHDYIITETEATCTEPGIRTYTCSRCGESYTEETGSALGHDYVDGVCTRCGANENSLADRLRAAFASNDWTEFTISGDEVLEESLTLEGSGEIYLECGSSLTLASGVTLILNGIQLQCPQDSLVDIQVGSTLSFGENDTGMYVYQGLLYMVGGRARVNGTLTGADDYPWLVIVKDCYSEEAGNADEWNHLCSLTELSAIQLQAGAAAPEEAFTGLEDYSGYGSVNISVPCTESESTLTSGTIPSNTTLNFYGTSDSETYTVTIPAGETVTVDGSLYLNSNVRLVVDGELILNSSFSPQVDDAITVNGTMTISEDGYLFCWGANGARRVLVNAGGVVNNYGKVYPESQAETAIGGEGTVNALISISEVALTVDAPAVGEAFAEEVTGGEHYTVETAEWFTASAGYFPVGDTVQPGTFYELDLTIKADEGYTFPDDAVITMNGKEAYGYTGTLETDDGSFEERLIVYYCFDLTEMDEGTVAMVYTGPDAVCYPTLQDALDASAIATVEATEDISEDASEDEAGTTEFFPVTVLMKDVEESPTVSSGILELDLNGCTITGTVTVSGSASLTIEDSVLDEEGNSTGAIIAPEGSSALVFDDSEGASLYVGGGIYKADGVPAAVIYLDEGSSVNVSGGKFYSSVEESSTSDGTTEESTDEESLYSTASLAADSIDLDSSSIGLLVVVTDPDTDLIITNGTFKGLDYGMYIQANIEAPSISVVGGDFDATAENGKGLAVESTTGVTLDSISCVAAESVTTEGNVSYISGAVSVTHEHEWDASSSRCTICGDYCEHWQYNEEYGWWVSCEVTETVKNPTHTEPGERRTYCSVCGHVTETVEIPATGHTWTAWSYDASSGFKTRHCTTCADVTESCLAGDVNLDGQANLLDLLTLKQALAAGTAGSMEETCKVAADLSCDGALNLKDMLMLKQQLANG